LTDFDFRLLVPHFSTTVLPSNLIKLEVTILAGQNFDFRLLVLQLLAAALTSYFYKHEVTLRVDLLLVVSTEAHFWISHSFNQIITKTINIS